MVVQQQIVMMDIGTLLMKNVIQLEKEVMVYKIGIVQTEMHIHVMINVT